MASKSEKPVPFKQQFDFEKRKAEAQRIREKYPDRIPVIVEQHGSALPNVDKSKFLIPSTLLVNNFLYIVRKRLKMGSDQALFVFVNNTLLNGQTILSSVYEQYKEADGFLYVKYSAESTFGG